MSRARSLRFAGAWIGLICLAAGVAPASAGAVTTRTRPFKRPPYYQGSFPVTASETVIHRAPVIALPPGTPASWLPQDALRGLAGDVDRFLQDVSLSRSGGPGFLAGGLDAPTVYFGCESDLIGECDPEIRQNVLATTGGSRAWQEEAARQIRASGAELAMLLELNLTPQWIHQKNLSGKKEVRLGTDHTQRLEWLTSLETPVWVLHLNAALVDADGKVVRSGAEGIWAVRTPFRISVLRAEKMMSDRDVEHVRTALVREDLPGRPLVWQEAARRLVQGLLSPEAQP